MSDISLFLCGDVMLGRGIDQILRVPSRPDLYESYARSAQRYVELAEARHGRIPRHVSPEYVWGDALGVLAREKPALRLVNLETAVTTESRPWPKGINYRMHPANVDCLTTARIDCCILANNHVLDWGREGLAETLDILRRAGMRVAGAGRDARDAAAAAVLPLAWAAEATMPVVNLLPDLSADRARHLAEIARLQRQPGDLALASIHWGGNWGYAIEAEQRAFAHALIEGGFDLVHGHSSHHPLGLEVYRRKLILYGCGDFINDYEGIEGYEEFRPDLVLMYLPHLDSATGVLRSLRIVPLQMRRFRLRFPSVSDTAWLFAVLRREGGRLGTVLAQLNDGSFSVQDATA